MLQAAYGITTVPRMALAGAETVFMVPGSVGKERLERHCDFGDAAKASGVRHLVYISVAGAAQDTVFALACELHASEECFRASNPLFCAGTSMPTTSRN